MEISMFSSFDPMTNNFFLNWLTILMMMTFPKNYWLSKKSFSLMNLIMYWINKLTHTKNNSINLLLMSTFFMIFGSNLLSLWPFMFPSSSHPSMNFSLAMSMWTMLMTYQMINKTNKLLIHLTPNNTPMLMIPLMIIMETISILIRPLTLTLRLSINITANHIMISFINQIISNSFTLLIIQLMYMNLEMMMSFIQAIIFTSLIMLYINEIN